MPGQRGVQGCEREARFVALRGRRQGDRGQQHRRDRSVSRDRPHPVRAEQSDPYLRDVEHHRRELAGDPHRVVLGDQQSGRDVPVEPALALPGPAEHIGHLGPAADHQLGARAEHQRSGGQVTHHVERQHVLRRWRVHGAADPQVAGDQEAVDRGAAGPGEAGAAGGRRADAQFEALHLDVAEHQPDREHRVQVEQLARHPGPVQPVGVERVRGQQPAAGRVAGHPERRHGNPSSPLATRDSHHVKPGIAGFHDLLDQCQPLVERDEGALQGVDRHPA